ncbi:MAG: hypothetical protein FJW36_18665 [Acidobacteria bacterium]|nr:hypothetical protein [Acidobacteriota bacterium]
MPVDLFHPGENFFVALFPLDPVADAKGRVQMNCDAAEQVRDKAAGGKPEHEAEHSRSGPDAGDGLAEDEAENAGARKQEDCDGDDVL